MSPAVITVDHQDSLFPVSKNQKAVEDHATISEDDRKRLQASGILDNAVSFSTIPIVGDAPTKSSGDGTLHLEFAEHALMGDTVTLKMKDGTSKIARDYPFTFYNGKLNLTYGQISALAGDFYGTYDPICEGQSQRDQIARFMRAYKTLAENPSSRQPQEAKDILAALQEEVNTVNTAIAGHRDPSEAYAKLPDKSIKFQLLTASRPSDQPSYVKLASLNLDHFGSDAETAYNAGHTAALQLAQKGDLDNAYRLNAFADHFLGDRFSAGHLRTPRRMLSGNPFKDLCAKYMHDEDNAIGLYVQNLRGDSWTIYGDKRFADVFNGATLAQCKGAVQESADEIYNCFRSKQMPAPESFGVWKIAPTLASANATQECCPLFVWRPGEKTNKEWRRKDINVRMNLDFTNNFVYAGTVLDLVASLRWKYPMMLDP